eukprot:6466230-Pyramimonas_sp.AAC.1
MAPGDGGAKCTACGAIKCNKPWYKWCANCWAPIRQVSPVDPIAARQPGGQWQHGPPKADGWDKKGAKGKKGGGKGGSEGGKGGALAPPRTPAAMLAQMALLMEQFKEEFPERDALAASIQKTATCVKSSAESVKDSLPLLQQH